MQRQAGHRGFLDFRGDGLDRFKITRAGDGKAGFNDVHPKLLEGTGNFEFFRQIQRGAGRLFAIAQRGVKDQDARLIGRIGGGG